MKTAIRLLLGACLLVLSCWADPAIAASSGAIRAYDDVVITDKSFAGQNLQQAEFAYDNLSDADFHDADLRGAVFNTCGLENANLRGIDFSDGIAYLTRFQGADLSDAVLTEAVMLRSTFEDAKIDGADFSFAVLDRLQAKLLCDRATGTNSQTGIATRESLGCS
ncbi:MAG: pentapeptide repeat-containing protein [Spirulinaceae cyanobacterium SM2_1_0]|nr:pentapeptide repeat-containing protein [Spirulinaceae cyanobacterium SM2_1_0]